MTEDPNPHFFPELTNPMMRKCFPTIASLWLLFTVTTPGMTDNTGFQPVQIRNAFATTHDGYSCDELIVRDTLREAFLKELDIHPTEAADHSKQRTALLALLRLRKTGKLNVAASKRSRAKLDGVLETAEIAIRTILDRHGVSTDEVLCDPVMRAELQGESEKLTPGVSAIQVRQAVLRLRKIRRLRPELVLRVASWKPKVVTMTIEEARHQIRQGEFPTSPGVYLFRDGEGYLYIGEAIDLADRMKQHLSQSHNTGLAAVLATSPQGDAQPGATVTIELHIFDSDSPARHVTMRRAYESELIRSRLPRFNLRP